MLFQFEERERRRNRKKNMSKKLEEHEPNQLWSGANNRWRPELYIITVGPWKDKKWAVAMRELEA